MRHTRIVFALLALAVNGLAQGAPMGTPGASPVATPQSDVAGVAPLPLTGERRAAFEACIAGALAEFRIPGAAVAVVQNGEVVYLNGLGVKQLGSTQPVTPDTMMIAPRPAPLSGRRTRLAGGNRLILDTGELSTELRARADGGADATVYLLYDPPLSFYSEAYGGTVTFAGGPDAPRLILAIPASPTGPEQVYVFEPVDAAQPSVD